MLIDCTPRPKFGASQDPPTPGDVFPVLTRPIIVRMALHICLFSKLAQYWSIIMLRRGL